MWDAFVAKLNASGSAIVYSTYLGGGSNDIGYGIAVDSSGAAYVAGESLSLDFPVFNPLQATRKGGSDVFITKLNPLGTAYAFSTYLGGRSSDHSYGIAIDNSGAVYVTGQTISNDFPLMNPIQGVYSGGASGDAFVTKIAPSGAAYLYSTYLGGTGSDRGESIAVDGSGAAYVTGQTDSTDFPLITPVQGAFAGGLADAFVTKIDSAGTAYLYSSYLGGAADDRGEGIAVDASGYAYITGVSNSTDFPLLNPMQGTKSVGYDAFITKIGETLPPVVILTITPDAVTVARGSVFGYTATATNTTASQQCFNYWENVNLPNGAVFPASGELFGPIHLCLAGGASQAAHLTHGVPMSAPVGAYIFNAYVGAYLFPALPLVVDEAHFNFDVTAFNPANPATHNSWRLIENGFRK